MNYDEYKQVIKSKIAEVGNKKPNYDQLLWFYSVASYMLEDKIDDRKLIFELTRYTKQWCDKLWQYKDDQDQYYALMWNCYLLEAPYLFDSFMLYLEKDREDKNKFYEPKRKQLLKIGVVQSMQDLEDDKLDLLSISLPPGTGKTTLEKFFTAWVIGKHPDDYNLFFSHSGDITRMYYDGVLDITTSSEYTWSTIFPSVKLKSTDAKRECINFNRYKPFANLQCTSVGSKNAGKVRCNRYLFCDDLIGGIEEALNKNQLDKLWNIYSTDARQRKLNEKVKEIHISTRWSTWDIIARLEKAYEGNPRAKFIAVPDIDPETNTSNFDYDYNGMSVEFFYDQALLMDEITYRCLYKNQPIEREGQLFPEAQLLRYFNTPQSIPEEITGQTDCKAKGTDYMVMPIFEKYDDMYYLVDVICNNGADFELQYEQLANKIVDTKCQSCEFESNMGGDRVAEEVNKRVMQKGWICNITAVPTESNKEARIFQCSNWILQHIIFKDKSLYTPQSPYGIFMALLVSYSVVGKNPVDDVPDVLSNFAIRKTKCNKVATIEAIHNPFRRF